MSGMNAFSASNRATVAVRTERFAWTVSTFRRLKARDSASRMGRPGAGGAGGGRMAGRLARARAAPAGRGEGVGLGRLDRAEGCRQVSGAEPSARDRRH